jgi:hypothetical protein
MRVQFQPAEVFRGTQIFRQVNKLAYAFETSHKAVDPDTYVDSTRFPYVVIPTGFEALPDVAKPGDVGLATHTPSGKSTVFIVGDAGGGQQAKLGEGSIALFVALGGTSPNPRTGAGVPRGAIQYIVFPKSRPEPARRWPRSQEEVSVQVQHLLATTPGIG